MMSVTVEQAADPAHTLPNVFSNHAGLEPWSGKDVDQLTHEDMVMIWTYCSEHGYRDGWNDEFSKRPGEGREGPFHRQLFGGELHAQWQHNYDHGAEEARNAGARGPKSARLVGDPL